MTNSSVAFLAAFLIFWKELDTIDRFLKTDDICLILWIDEEHVDEKTLSFYETDLVMIVPCLSHQLMERLSLLKPALSRAFTSPSSSSRSRPSSLTTSPISGDLPIELMALNVAIEKHPFQGRLRFVVNPRNPHELTTLLQREHMINFPILLIPDNLKTVGGANPTVEIQKFRTLKPDVIVASRGDVEITNFCRMALVVWLNPHINREMPGGPSSEQVELAQRHVVSGINRHGTVVIEMFTAQVLQDFLATAKSWISRVTTVRILVSHHNFQTVTGKEPLPDYSSSSITSLLLAVRTKLGLPKVPVLIFSTNLASVHDSIYSLPDAKPTDSLDEVVDFGAMWPLTWVPEWSLFEFLQKDANWRGEMHVFDIACFNLFGAHRSSGLADPYAIVSLKSNGKTISRLKTRKQETTNNPTWMSTNWLTKASSGDSLHIVIKSADSIVAKDTHLGEIEIFLKDFFRSPVPLLEQTWPLVPRKGSSRPISGTIMVRLGLSITNAGTGARNSNSNGSDYLNGDSSPSSSSSSLQSTSSPNLKSSDAWKEETRTIKLHRGAHFGRSLGDSMHTAEEVGMRHIAQVCILYIVEKGINSIGIFRVVGNRRKVREAQEEFDAGREAVLDDPFVAASLLKQYFRDLPDPLISSHVYKDLLKLQALSSYKELLPELRRICSLLSRAHRDLLADLLELLHRISENEAVNMMNAKNLATVFAPTLCISKTMTSTIDINELLLDTNAIIDLVHIMISFNRYIFPETPEDEKMPQEVIDFDAASSKAPMDRSPPSSPEHSEEE